MLKKETGATVTIPVLPERARSECARSMGAVGIVTATPRDEAHSLRPRWAAFLNILSGALVIGEQLASLWPSRTTLGFAMASGQAFLAPRFEVCWKMHLGQV